MPDALPEAVSAEHLTDVLRAAGILSAGRVASVAVESSRRIWLARRPGEAPPRYDEPIGAPWREAFGETHAALRAYVGKLSDADADRVVRYTDFRGNTREMALAQTITQLVNHGTAHRAETGLVLERLGRSPGDLDYSLYCFEHP